MKVNKNYFRYGVFLLLLLGLLSAFGPFVTDMYLPALPQLQAFFSTNASLVQLSLSASMLGLGAGQVFIGPLSDKYGRRPLLIASLWIFVVTTVACIFAPTIEVFVVLRLLQGIGGAGGVVLSKSVVTDRYWGERLAKMMAIMGAINGVAPVTAPVVGGMMTDTVGWQGIFTVLLGVGIVLLTGSYFIRESLPVQKRSQTGLLRTFASYRQVLRNRRFVTIWLQHSFTGGVFFAYIASSPFIFQQHYGFSPFWFSLIFGFNAFGIGVASALSMKFKTPAQSTRTASFALFVLTIGQMAAMLMDAPFLVYETLSFLMMLGIGLTFASSVTLAMNLEHEHAGAASALIGAMLFAAGAVVSPIVGIGNILHATAVVYVVCATFALVFERASRLA